jgi:cytochrome P450
MISSSTAMQTDMLNISDPKALQYVFQTSGYNFPKTTESIHYYHTLFGDGIITAASQTHARQRKAMLPSFSVPQLRTFSGTFQQYSGIVSIHFFFCDVAHGFAAGG